MINNSDTQTAKLAANASTRFSQKIVLLALLCLATMALLVGGYRYYQWQMEVAFQQHYVDLQSIARLKAGQIQAWRQERLADARMNSSGMVRSLASNWARTGDPATLADIKARLHFFLENEGYYNIILADLSGKIQLSLVPRITTLESEEDTLLKQAATAGTAVFGDFFYCGNCRRIHLNVAAPILDNTNTAVALLLLISDPERTLYPLIKFWPTASATAETLLVRKEGDHIRYLNQARYQSEPPLTSTHPVTDTQSPAVQAVLGNKGMFIGRDYRGEEVLSDLSAIAETNWYMVAKTDTRAMLSEVRLRGVGVLLLVLMGTLVAGALIKLNSLSRQKALAEALLRAKQERRQTREEIRATLYGIAEGVIATNSQRRITRMNPAAEALTGWPEADALGKSLEEVYRVVNQQTGEGVVTPVDQVLRQGSTVGMSNHILLVERHGKSIPIAASGAPIRNEAGAITGVVLVFRDQSKQRAMEKDRAESARRYSDLVETISDFIWETGPDLCYTYASKRAIEILGYQPGELIGRPWIDNVSRVEPYERIKNIIDTCTNCQPISQVSLIFSKKDNTPVILESSATPVFDQHGSFGGYRGTSRDVTERKKAEEQQRRLQDDLQQSQKMETIGRLAGGIAHDFNNMLTVICSYVEIILNEIDQTHPFYKRLSDVHQAALHSADLTRQLLMFARRQTITPKVLDINETIAVSLRMLHRLIGEDIKLAWNPGSGLWKVKMDATQVGQILANLAVNARDAITSNGRIVIETANVIRDQPEGDSHSSPVSGNCVLIRISDNGCGMDEATLTHLFEPFFTTKERGRGTGLGLASVYGIVSQNNGLIEVQSQPGQGSTFSIFLPQAPVDIVLAQPSMDNDPLQGTETILFVDDEPAILEIGTYILELQGYTVLTASSPGQALSLLLSYGGAVDLLITDVIMPEMNGPDLARQVQMMRPETKVLFVSGYTADTLAPHGVLDGTFHFLEKPFTRNSLGHKVREVLNRSMSSRFN